MNQVGNIMAKDSRFSKVGHIRGPFRGSVYTVCVWAFLMMKLPWPNISREGMNLGTLTMTCECVPDSCPMGRIVQIGNSVTGIFGDIGINFSFSGLPSGDFAIITALHCLCDDVHVLWNALNDYMDIEIDRINRPDRPLPRGRFLSCSYSGDLSTAVLSASFLIVAAYVSHSGEIGLDGWLPSLAIWVMALLLLFNYESPSKLSFRMKDRGLPGIWLSACPWAW